MVSAPTVVKRNTEKQRLEPEFLALRASLTARQRNILDDYLSACEEMDHALTALAWNRNR